MVRFVNYFFTILILPLTALAGDYFSVFEQQIAGADKFVAVNPILDQERELAGFVFCDAANHEVVVYDLEGGVRNRISVPGEPVTTINSGFRINGELTIYVGEVRDYQPYITMIGLGNGRVEQISRQIEFYAPVMGNQTVDFIRLRFEKNEAVGNGVLVSIMATNEWYETTQGFNYTSTGGSILYDSELELIRDWPASSNVVIGNVADDRQIEMITSANYAYSYDYRDLNAPDYYGEYNNTKFRIADSYEGEVFSRIINNGWTDRMWAGEFNSSIARDELIYCGTADLNSGTRTTQRFTACYSFDGTTADEVWQYGSSTFFPEFVYRERNSLVGLDRKAVKLIDYRVGSLIDSVELDRIGTAHSFFETGLERSELNLVLIYDDTVVVNQFNAPTYTPTQTTEEVELPATFALHQNHPNPFNLSTMISFDNEESQQLTLVVFNILGREIATLYSGVTSPGYYQFSWNGLDENGHEQATGIYFAQLRSAKDSQMIKLVLLK